MKKEKKEILGKKKSISAKSGPEAICFERKKCFLKTRKGRVRKRVSEKN